MHKNNFIKILGSFLLTIEEQSQLQQKKKGSIFQFKNKY